MTDKTKSAGLITAAWAPTEEQILDASEKAGLWPNTVRTWMPAFHRFFDELALTYKATDATAIIAGKDAEIAQGKALLREQMALTNERTEEVLKLRAEVERLTQKNAELRKKMHDESAQHVQFMLHDHPKALAARDATIAAQSAALAKAREAVTKAKLTEGWDEVPYRLHVCLDALFDAIDALGQQPSICGLSVIIDPTMPPDQLSIRQNGNELGRVVNIPTHWPDGTPRAFDNLEHDRRFARESLGADDMLGQPEGEKGGVR